MAKPNGAILYRGPSLLDGADIVVIAIGTNSGSENRKTGRMLQTYILRADALPAAVVRTGNDSSICGDCTHRGDGTGKGRTDRKSTRLNSSHSQQSRMPSSA